MREILGVTAEVKYIHLELLNGLVVFLKVNFRIKITLLNMTHC